MEDYSTLVQQVQAGQGPRQHAAFDELMRRFRGMAYHYALGILGDPQQAEDATQEAFLTAYKRINQLREPAAFPTWLRLIVRTQCDRLARSPHARLLAVDGVWPDEDDNPEQALETREIIDRVQDAIRALPEHERSVTESFYLGGQSQKEIAERFDIPVATVKKRLQYARQHLRMLVADFNETLDRVLQPQQPRRQFQPIPIQRRRPEDEY